MLVLFGAKRARCYIFRCYIFEKKKFLLKVLACSRPSRATIILQYMRVFFAVAVLPVVASFAVGSSLAPASRTAQVSFCTRLLASPLANLAAVHPAVAGWPEKYSGKPDAPGPRVLHDKFEVQQADYALLVELDVENWSTWTTAGNDRWVENVTRKDKDMPYGELSYLTSGKLEIVPKDTGIPVLVSPGDFVTFPENFVSDWTVLEELTWHYFLY